MNKKLSAFSLLILWSIFRCAICAASVPDSSGREVSAIDTLHNSIVTALDTRTITPVHQLSGDLLRKLSSQSVADALRYFSGVQIKDYGGIGGIKTVNVRSLGSQHTGIFYDGIKINNAQNGQVDLGRYSLENMEAVSLYNGQKSELLQSAAEYASSATVYLRTRKPELDTINSKLTAKLKFGSFSSISPLVRYERKAGKVLISTEATYLYSKGDYRFHIQNALEDTTARRANGDVGAFRAELGIWAQPMGGVLQIHAYHYSSERGLPGPVIRRLSDQYATKDRQWDRNTFLQGSWTKNFGKLAFKLNAKGSFDYLEYISDPLESSSSAYIHNHYRQKDFYGNASLSWYPFPEFSLNLAYDLRWSDLDCDVPMYSYVQRFDNKGAIAVDYRPGKFVFQASALYTDILDITKGSAGPIRKISPAFSCGWNSKTLSLRGFYKSIFRSPTLNDLYYGFVGSANLKPENADQLDLGFEFRNKTASAFSWKISADVYYNKISNKIVAMPVKSQFRWTMMNYGKVEGYGCDAMLHASYVHGKFNTECRLSYNYEVAKEKTDPNIISYNGQIPYTPWNSGSAILSFGYGSWYTNISVLYTGVRYRSTDNTPQNRLGDWTCADMSIAKTLELKNHHELEISLDVNNFLNSHYEVVSRYPMPGINFMLKTTYRL